MHFSPVTCEQTRLLANMTPEQQERFIRMMTDADTLKYDADFEQWVHDGQVMPSGDGWRIWLMMAGRGYGKTRAGAEWITKLATQRLRPVRIALVGATEDEVRRVMVEGESGLLAVGDIHGKTPRWEPSNGRLRWRGGSEAFVYTGAEPNGLRGPQHHYAWCDELAKWSKPDETWDNLQMTLRLGERPRALVTTTPRAVPVLTRIGDDRRCVKSGGRTADNMHLPEDFVAAMIETYGGTRIGRQELDGELIEDVEGALWPRALIEASRAQPLLPACREGLGVGLSPPTQPFSESHPPPAPPCSQGGEFARVVIGVDPPGSATGDACGIVAVGLGRDGIGYVLGDHSASGLSPEGWRAKWRMPTLCTRPTGSSSRRIWAATWSRAC